MTDGQEDIAHEFIQLPIVDRDKQERQTVTEQELNTILSGVKEKFAVVPRQNVVHL